jgi:hypothetical protein
VIRGCIAVHLEAPRLGKTLPRHFGAVAKASLLSTNAAERFLSLAAQSDPRKRLSAIAAPVKGEIRRFGSLKPGFRVENCAKTPRRKIRQSYIAPHAN